MGKTKKKSKKKGKAVLAGRWRFLKRGKVIKPSKRQTNVKPWNKKRDKVWDAMLPGKRISYKGNVYYEYRKNRSDLNRYL